MPNDNRKIIEEAYSYCLAIAREHYENFPVASFLIPRRLRKHVAAVYAFARYADDIADEGMNDKEERKKLLDAWRYQLMNLTERTNDNPIYIALGETTQKFKLPITLFSDLLDAFEQDIMIDEYETFDQVLDYCTRSANPIGRLMLLFFNCSNEYSIPPADALCTGLQLANFWQDISIDIQKSRIYLPREDRLKFQVSEKSLFQKNASGELQKLIRFEIERTRTFFEKAKGLFELVPLRLRFELKAIWRGGVKILDAIESSGFDPLGHRPQLNASDKIQIMFSSLLPLRYRKTAYATV